MAVSLASVARGVRIKAPKVVMYGVGGIGKTTFGAGSRNPIFIFLEEGQGFLDVPRFEIVKGDPIVRSYPEVIECLTALWNEEHDYGTVVIDTLDVLEPLIWKYTAEKWNKQTIEEFGYGKGYGYACEQARTMLQWLDRLRTDKGMAIVLLCHCETVKFESPESQSFDRYDLALHKRLTAEVDHWADCVLFANYREYVVRDDEGFNRERARGVGVGERVLYCERRPHFRAKNRYGLPPEIDLSWAAFESSIAAPTEQPQPKKTKKD